MRGKKLVDACVVHEICTDYNPEWAKLMQEAVWKQLEGEEQLDVSLSIRLEFLLTKRRYEGKMDLDNMVKKGVIDSLSASEHDERTEYPIYDDCWIENVEATKIPTDESDFRKEKTHIEIWECGLNQRETKKALARLRAEYEKKEE